jgi:2-(1,2-epoxy-1,2-dihydrophenyl)acetyl-CoA isomerase
MLDLVRQIEERALWITLSRPQARNALTRELVQQVTAAFQSAAADPNIRAVVLTGADGHFCAGADLRKTFEDDPGLLDHLEPYMNDFHALVRSIVRCPKPTLAVIDGAAVGFGADLAFCCDLRLASSRAYVEESFVKLGLMPDGGGTFWLPRLLGTARAMQMMLLAERLDARRLHDLGLVVSISSPEELQGTAKTLAARLVAGPPLAFAAIKRAVYASWGDLEEALRLEREGQLLLLRSKDAMEGITSFLHKRPPTFEGA